MKTTIFLILFLAMNTVFAQTETITGDFVLNVKSFDCFCSKSGKLLTSDKKVIEVCLGENKLPDLKNLSVKGHYEHKTVPPQIAQECDEYGEKDVFIVESFVVNGDIKLLQSFEGKYKSLEGVMTQISCYCSNGGTLTTKDKKVIPICLDKLKMSDSKPTSLKVIGFYQDKTISPEPTNPCPAGTMTIFQVLKYE